MIYATIQQNFFLYKFSWLLKFIGKSAMAGNKNLEKFRNFFRKISKSSGNRLHENLENLGVIHYNSLHKPPAGFRYRSMSSGHPVTVEPL